MDDILQRLEQEVAVFARRMESARTRTYGTAQLDRSAYLLLLFLHTNGECTPREYATTFALDISTVSRQIPPLVEMGLIERHLSPTDRRSSVLQITEHGIEKLQEVRNARRELYAEVLDDWTEDEHRQFLQLLERFNGRLKKRADERAAQQRDGQ
ncbi:MarR family winged helix-turn-helix transcriptional regulator [Alicyclobacillus fastidiosus]|uniref:MarR family transcriptional regulator n=1 Tax=Alicyclobacillus fastidiosus TaxID=392011 RepID=A0ABV5AHA3_9BACL|nr:MarR family transcriptional regulator [Alicyclobacillus fastidiosus]WEH09236.1 MarR family transcriptional regulator [Alicyclobacillus fastidiosus]